MRFLVTGGAGFIGSALCRHLVLETGDSVFNVDALTYAASPAALAAIEHHPRYGFRQADIRDRAAMAAAFADFRPDAVIHLAAESHVDRSIDGPAAFVDTNVQGTFVVLEAALAHWRTLDAASRDRFRLVHVSTDEVFGSLGDHGKFVETTPYAPRSPYAATKAASDHLARAWRDTFGLPTIVTNCGNNFGPYQFPEKLIPLTILNALERLPLPVYGTGANVRDWIHVEDHAQALRRVATAGVPGESYNIGASSERRNLDVVHRICDLLDEEVPGPGPSRRTLIRFVTDRPGHDQRYALDAGKIKAELGWAPQRGWDDAMRATVRWYLDNRAWWEPIRAGRYAGQRLGLSGAAAGAR